MKETLSRLFCRVGVHLTLRRLDQEGRECQQTWACACGKMQRHETEHDWGPWITVESSREGIDEQKKTCQRCSIYKVYRTCTGCTGWGFHMEGGGSCPSCGGRDEFCECRAERTCHTCGGQGNGEDTFHADGRRFS